METSSDPPKRTIDVKGNVNVPSEVIRLNENRSTKVVVEAKKIVTSRELNVSRANNSAMKLNRYYKEKKINVEFSDWKSLLPQEISHDNRVTSFQDTGEWKSFEILAAFIPELILPNDENKSTSPKWEWTSRQTWEYPAIMMKARSGMDYTNLQINELYQKSPTSMNRIIELVKGLKDHINKQINPILLMRKPGYDSVLAKWKEKLQTQQFLLAEHKRQQAVLVQQMEQLLQGRDAELLQYDPNHKVTKIDAEKLLEDLGFSNLTVSRASTLGANLANNAIIPDF